MKKKYLLMICATTLLFASCASKPHYGCRGGRCIVETPKETLRPALKNANA